MKQIASALVKAQKNFSPALKASTNPHFKNKYADLAACVEAVIDSLNANGIYLNQTNHESDNGVTVETIFVHESGETFSAGKLHVPADKQNAQGYGSALTYARRYSLIAACGIAPEDDDGNEAAKDKKPKKETRSVEYWMHEIGKCADEKSLISVYKDAVSDKPNSKAEFAARCSEIKSLIISMREQNGTEK